MKKRKTLADVAEFAGVSKMTASRALRGDKDVSLKARDQVNRAAKEIGYVGNTIASSLSNPHSNLIGVVVPNLTNVVFPEVMTGITEALLDTGYQPAFGMTEYDKEREYTVVARMMSWRPSGMIVTGLEQSKATRKLLADADFPVVQIMDTEGDPIDSVVGFSQSLAGTEIALALLKVGRRKFGYVGCNLDKDVRARKRRDGFANEIAESGLTFQASVTSHELSSIEVGRRLTSEILDQQADLDCIYFSNDDLAFGGLCHCIDAGLNVPDDIALVGFNGLTLLNAFPGLIATSRTKRNEIGRAAAEMVCQRLGDPNTLLGRKLLIQPEVDLGDLNKR